MIIAVLVMVLMGLVLALVLIPGLVKTDPELVAYVDPGRPERPDVHRPKVSVERRPAAPASQPVARVIAAQNSAPIALQVPEVSEDFTALGSSVDDFGIGWQGEGAGTGAGGGGFGSNDRASGGLGGWMYDFKQTPDGDKVKYDLANPAEFVDRVVRLQRSRFSEASLARHFRAPNNLFLTHLAIPLSPAAEGPAFFGARESIEPSGWIARYRGTITVPKTGTYRFSGLGDDYLVVLLDGRMRLAACWGDIQSAVAGRWDPAEPTGKFTGGFSGMRLVYGDWVRLSAGQKVDIDVVIGERPGGKVGFVLHVEEKGVEYRKAADGRPVLPLFTTVPLAEDEVARLRAAFGSYDIEWDNVPVFSAR